MSEKKNFKIQGRVWLVILLMAGLSLVIVLGTAAVREWVFGAYDRPVEDLPTVVLTEEISLSDAEKMHFHALAAYTCFDEAGKTVAFRVETQVIGYNEEVPIVVASTLRSDGAVLCGIEVVKQKESTYYGARIATSEFSARFSGRRMPLLLTGTAGRGAHIDGISGATLSSQAVVDAVNHAGAWVRAHIAKGE